MSIWGSIVPTATKFPRGKRDNCETWENSEYSQLSPCRHLAITDTPIIRMVAKSQAKTNYRCLIEINSGYYGLSLIRTLTEVPYSVRYKGSCLYSASTLFVGGGGGGAGVGHVQFKKSHTNSIRAKTFLIARYNTQ